MNSQELQKMRDKATEEKKKKHIEGKLKQAQPSNTASPPSSSSSPAHEFSFTISLHPPSTTIPDKAKPPSSSSFAIDLSPADDIFFHGHLLPLHLLSHLPVSPRSSINSFDSFTLPIGDQIQDQNLNKSSTNNDRQSDDRGGEIKGRTKSNSFSLFGLSKWRKGCEAKEKEEKERNKRKLSFDVSQALKRYMRIVRPLLSFRGRRGNVQYHRQAYSYSGNLSLRRKPEVRGRRGEYSAPVSMRTSPTNSGLLVATGAVPTNTSESTMEELQAAIQAAIAHCKNSIAKEEKIKCQD